MTDEPIGLPTATAGQLRSARRLLQRKQRERLGAFLVEGPQAVRECVTTASRVFASTAAAARHADLVSAAQAADVPVLLTDEVDQLTDSATPQGIVAVHPLISSRLSTETPRPSSETSRPSSEVETPQLLVIAAQIRDPGNLGTLIRCADAFGADGVILTEGSVDPHNPKTVRASVGSLFHLPMITGATLVEAVDHCHRCGATVLAADGTGTADLDQLAAVGELSRPTAWLFGNEAWGLPEGDRELADRVVRVPMWGRAESLNLATAAAVCLYATGSAQRAHTGT